MTVHLHRRCAHCGLDAGPSPREVDGRLFCCAGCEAVYGVLRGEGLGAFYEAGGAGSLAPRLESARAACRTPPAESPPVLDALEAAGETTLDVAGMRCASCAWLIEEYLGRRAGVAEVNVSYAAGTCRLRWDRDRTSLAHLLAELRRIGYRARPTDPRLRLLQSDREGRALLVRFGVSAFLAMNVMLLAIALYAGEFRAGEGGIGSGTRGFLRLASALLATLVVFYAGWPFFRGAIAAARARRATMDTLIALGAGAAWSLSIWGLATGSAVYFDTAAMIVTLILGGRVVEESARRRGTRSIRSLLEMEPVVAHAVTPDGTATVAADAVLPGQVVELRPGERASVDGLVVEGDSAVDEAFLCGEAVARAVGVGSEVRAGSLNTWGVLRIRAVRVGADTGVSRIAAAALRALAAKAPLERLADRAMGVFVPAIVIVAAAAALGRAASGAGLARALLVAVSVVVVACPCALGLATPAALAVGLGEAARRGIFFRGADVLERAAAVKQVAFDKTGTITDGRLAIREARPAPGWSAEDLIRMAGSAEMAGGHGFGAAIIEEAERRRLQLEPARRACIRAGAGVEALVAERDVLVGSAAFLRDHGIDFDQGKVADTGGTVALVAVDGVYAGAIEAADRVRAGAPDAVERLAEMGIASSLLSGDREPPVRAAAVGAGIPAEGAHASLSPEGKAAAVAALRRAGGFPVAMVGDGINDAPALAAADVGIAMGTGADLALETADVALTSPELEAVPALFALARRARRVVRQNLVWAAGYNLLAVPLAAAGLLHPIVAAGAMALSSVSVLVNSLRLRAA